MAVKQIRRMVWIFCSLFLILTTVVSTAQELNKAWDANGFKAPESVVYDAKHDLLYVSNVNGAPLEKDGNGFISKLSTSGEIQTLEWITSLNGPKGMEIHGDTLYVTDINQLVVINIIDGNIVKRYTIEDGVFFNDIGIDKAGNVYVSDMLTDTIYRLSGTEFSLWLRDPKLAGPNGLLVSDGQLLVASWGKLSEGFATSVAGNLKSVSLADKAITDLGNGTPIGNLDGLEPDGNGNFYVTDWLSGKLLLVKSSGAAEMLLDINQGSADHEFIKSKGLILIPMMNDNLVSAYQL